MAALPPGPTQDSRARGVPQARLGGMSRFQRAFGFAARGLALAWREEQNLRIEAGIGLAAVLLAWWLRAPLAPVLLAGGLVFVMELLNSAIERVVDLASPEQHELAGHAKDLAAAAVLLASLTAFAVGLVVLGPPLLAKLGVLS